MSQPDIAPLPSESLFQRGRRWVRRLEGAEPADVETQYLRALFRNFLSNSPLAVFATLFLYGAAPQLSPGKATLYWVFWYVAFHVLRTLFGVVHMRRVAMSERELVFWAALSVVLQLIDGVLMLTLALVIYPAFDPVAQSILLMVSLVIVGATASSFAWRWWSMVVYVPPTYFGFAWATWQMEHSYAKPLAMLILALFVLYLFHARNHRSFVVQALDLAQRNGELARGNGEMARELKVKNDELQEVATARSRLLATVSHDLRQPAHAIGLLCERAMLEANPAALKESLGDLNELSQSLSASLTTLMDLTRLDAGLVRVNLKPTFMGQVMQRLEAEFGNSARSKGLEFKVGGCDLWVQSDADLLHGVLANLVSNAIKYTQQGRVHVVVAQTPQFLTVSVRDSGGGIPKDKLDLIFREFVRLDASESGTEGLGLGLSIVRRYAALMDHELTVESEPKRGSTFSVRLSITEPDSEAAQVQEQSRPADMHDRRLAGLEVLIVDNMELLLTSMSKTLATWGCKVHSARNLSEALELADTQALDIVLTDFHLGDREPDGLALITAMRSLKGSETSGLPAILMTGDVSSRLESEAQRRKVKVLHKPVRPALLQTCMLQVLPRTADHRH